MVDRTRRVLLTKTVVVSAMSNGGRRPYQRVCELLLP